MMADWTDEQVASAVRMLMRDQLDHEVICVLARDRIRSLASERDHFRKALDEIRVEAMASGTDSGNSKIQRMAEAALRGGE